MSTKVIRNLGTQLCGIDSGKLGDGSLQKGKRLHPIAKRNKSEDSRGQKASQKNSKEQNNRDRKKGKKEG
jgi:hypothetical protein